MIGLSVADWLSERGKSVEVLDSAIYVGTQVDQATLPMIYMRLLKKGVKLTPLTRVKVIEENAVVVANVLSGFERRIEPVETVVVAGVGIADESLYHDLKTKVKELFLIGSALAPRKLFDVIWDGARVGREI
jgi:NADPH-dependent 2,4-dienoyl-CoA reductase/sulfur reductase-like enzyme